MTAANPSGVYVKPVFLAALDGADTDEKRDSLFTKYGSHFLKGAEMGGRTTYSSTTNKLTVDRTYSIDVSAEVSYKGLTGQLSASDQTKYAVAMSSFSYNSETEMQAKGGEGILAMAAFSGPDGFSAWKASVASTPAFIDFVQTVPMAGIWTLCETPDQANALEAYFMGTWGPTQSNLNQLYCNYVDALAVVYGGSSSVAPPDGYTKIPYDLNAGAGGDYIYLCYHKASYSPNGGNKAAVVALTAIYNNEPVPEGYTKVDVDVNTWAFAGACASTVVALAGATL